MQRYQNSISKRITAITTIVAFAFALTVLSTSTARAAQQTAIDEPSPLPYILLAVGGVAVAGLLVWVLWPSSPATTETTPAKRMSGTIPLVPEVATTQTTEAATSSPPPAGTVVAPWIGSGAGGLGLFMSW